MKVMLDGCPKGGFCGHPHLHQSQIKLVIFAQLKKSRQSITLSRINLNKNSALIESSNSDKNPEAQKMECHTYSTRQDSLKTRERNGVWRFFCSCKFDSKFFWMIHFWWDFWHKIWPDPGSTITVIQPVRYYFSIACLRCVPNLIAAGVL